MKGRLPSSQVYPVILCYRILGEIPRRLSDAPDRAWTRRLCPPPPPHPAMLTEPPNVEPQITADLIHFLQASYALVDARVTEDMRLLEEGVIDSLGLLDLVAFVEEKYGIYVSDAEVDLDNFGSVRTIAAFVASKKGSG